MQTFLPYDDYKKSAKCLDYRRLGKQRVECYQILITLYTKRKAWSNHPATKMWRGYEIELCEYAIEMCNEWIKRGYKDNLSLKINNIKDLFVNKYKIVNLPHWINDIRVYESHKSRLLQKDNIWYSQFDWNVDCNLPYFWPV